MRVRGTMVAPPVWPWGPSRTPPEGGPQDRERSLIQQGPFTLGVKYPFFSYRFVGHSLQPLNLIVCFLVAVAKLPVWPCFFIPIPAVCTLEPRKDKKSVIRGGILPEETPLLAPHMDSPLTASQSSHQHRTSHMCG